MSCGISWREPGTAAFDPRLSSQLRLPAQPRAVALERQEGAEHQKHNRPRSDQAGVLAKPGHDRPKPGWKNYSYEPTEDGEPAKNRHEYRPAARPDIVSAYN